MASTAPPTLWSGIVGKLIVLKETRDRNGYHWGYEWINRPGVPVAVQPLHPEPSILHAKPSLFLTLAAILKEASMAGWIVHTIGIAMDMELDEDGTQEQAVSVILVPARNGE